MISLLDSVATHLKLLTKLDDTNVRPISQINDLKGGSWKYAVTLEIGDSGQYKGRKGRNETLLFINCYSQVATNPDMAVLAFAQEIMIHIDEVDLSNVKIKTLNVKCHPANPQPEKNSLLDAWQSVVAVQVRWMTSE